MDSLYGINVKNKFDLFYDEDVDPLEILAQQENAKKTEDKKKKDDKGKKTKSAKKQVLKTENKIKPVEEIKPEKEGIICHRSLFADIQIMSIRAFFSMSPARVLLDALYHINGSMQTHGFGSERMK